MKFFRFFIASVFTFSLVVSCGNGNLKPIETPCCAPPTPTLPVEREWTFMVFMNGNNDLDEAGTDDLNEMMSVGSNPLISIVVQKASLSAGKTQRLYVKKGSTDLLQDMGAVDMGDWKELVKFTTWAMQTYPAKKYLLSIWDHGSGWDYRKGIHPFRGISYDDVSGNNISTVQLKDALIEIKKATNRKIDVMGHDACLMGMIEIVYEMKDYIDYFVGSEETEPFDGWPYDGILEALLKNPGMTPDALSTMIVSKYGASYSGGSQGSESVTQSAMRMEGMTEFSSALNYLIAYITEIYGDQSVLINRALDDSQDFALRQNKDIWDFTKILGRYLPNDQELFKRIDTFQKAFPKFVIANFKRGSSLKNANGLAMYLPYNRQEYISVKDRYLALDWAVDAVWDEFMAYKFASAE